jgi:hypothetical protein
MSSPIEHDGAFTIYDRDIQAYKRDSKRSLKGYWNRKYAHLKSMWNTVTLFTPLLMVGTVLATHSIA